LVSVRDCSTYHDAYSWTVIMKTIHGGMWEKYEWVEDLVAEALRVGVEVIGQEYVVKRMGWGSSETKAAGEGEATAESKTDNVVGEPGELVEKPKLGEET